MVAQGNFPATASKREVRLRCLACHRVLAPIAWARGRAHPQQLAHFDLTKDGAGRYQRHPVLWFSRPEIGVEALTSAFGERLWHIDCNCGADWEVTEAELTAKYDEVSRRPKPDAYVGIDVGRRQRPIARIGSCAVCGGAPTRMMAAVPRDAIEVREWICDSCEQFLKTP